MKLRSGRGSEREKATVFAQVTINANFSFDRFRIDQRDNLMINGRSIRCIVSEKYVYFHKLVITHLLFLYKLPPIMVQFKTGRCRFNSFTPPTPIKCKVS